MAAAFAGEELTADSQQLIPRRGASRASVPNSPFNDIFMKIRWMPLAKQDLESAYDYVRRDNPKAASRLITQLLSAAEMLATYPLAGLQGRVPSTRELTIARTPYIIAYRHAGNEIQILSVTHTSRRWPMTFGG